MNIPDTIERSIILPVSRERVWAAITHPDKITKWFGTRAEFENLRVGEPILFAWDDDIFRGRIEHVEPLNRFSYRWQQMKDTDPTIPFEELSTTLVTFTLEDVTEGTRLTVVETGFSDLPEAIRTSAWNENNSGWKAEFDDLQNYLIPQGTGKLS